MDDMSELIKQVSSMIEKDGIPDNVKELISNINSSNHNSSNNSSANSINMNNDNSINNDFKSAFDTFSNSNSEFSKDSNSSFSNIDFNTILKLKNLMDSLNTKDDPRVNLLRSLKPYLKDSKKSKLDQYMQFLNMSKMFDLLRNNKDNNRGNDSDHINNDSDSSTGENSSNNLTN